MEENSIIFSNEKNDIVRINELKVNNFRNYRYLNLAISDKQIVLTGRNGSGKTNLIEAISLLTAGKGLRRAKREELKYKTINDVNSENIKTEWSIFSKLSINDNELTVGTSSQNSLNTNSRTIKIDGNKSTQQDLSKIFSISWLTPQMDGLFIGSSSNRRRFIDQLAASFDNNHISRLTKYKKAWGQRNFLLFEGKKEENWILSLEKILAETGVAITATRTHLIKQLNEISKFLDTSFPKFNGLMTGYANEILESGVAAIDLEDKIMNDAKFRRSNGDYSMHGPHESDIVLNFNGLNANQCSTGEQKALLISLVISHTYLLDTRMQKTPILLLDDVISHLDEFRRKELFEFCSDLKSQIWYTGTEKIFFNDIKQNAQFIDVEKII